MQTKISSDHSLTYKKLNFRNFFHRKRLQRTIKILADAINRRQINSYVDVGSSNGFITNIIAKKFKINKTYAFDFVTDHFIYGRKKYPAIKFMKYDLDKKSQNQTRYDLVTCFSTLEHIQNIETALENLLSLGRKGGIVFITVPIEIGWRGVIKFLIKNIFYTKQYPTYELKSGRLRFFWALITGQDVTLLRKKVKVSFGYHYGFSHRRIDQFLKRRKVNYRSLEDISTKYYLIRS